MPLIAGVAGGVWWRWGRTVETVSFRTSEIVRDDVRQVVTATGTLQAEQTVEVGTQVSGIVSELGADFNDQVTAGQVLARIDTSLLEADVASANARLAETKATDARLALEEARIVRLHGVQAATDQELEVARAERAVAAAQVRTAEVSVERARRNLRYATINAPITGTVIASYVEVGQTVNAGLSAPKLFLLAGDLAQMRILAPVDESDIGLIKEGQGARFTVQAYPDRTFTGVVQQVRLQSATAESVVTYTVVVTVANEDGALLPGMTASVEFIVAEAPAALCVAGSALRYRPDETVAVVGAPAAAPTPDEAGGRGGGGKRRTKEASSTGTLWLPEGTAVRALPVTVGLRGSTCTEVSGAGVDEGVSAVVGVDRSTASASGNPLAPKGAAERRPGGF